jgi:hypothetical protein
MRVAREQIVKSNAELALVVGVRVPVVDLHDD